MEGSYDPVFHQSASSTPMSVTVKRAQLCDSPVNMYASSRSPNAPSGTANQYKANVNRTKTRKWVEAKTVDYGGDDWGGDYDEEPDEPEPEPQPPPKPQGPRPSASFSNSQPPSPAGPRPLQTTGPAVRPASPVISSTPGLRTPVGVPALHIQTQHHPAAQPTTVDTGSPWRQGPPSRGSTPGIERQREMSPHAVGVPQSAATSSVYSAVAEFGQMYGDRGASPGPFQGQRPRRLSPGPQSASSSVPTRFPRRKSSLGQHDAPPDNIYSPVHGDSSRQMGSRPGSSHTNAGPIMSPNKPWMVEGTVGGPRSASPSGSLRSPITTGKALPFVRPADIYKKLEEEKEKVRRSVDSGRPSMDSLGLGRGSDTTGSMRTQSPPRTSQNTRQAQEHGQVRQDSELLSPGIARVTDVPFTEEVQVEPKDRSDATPGTSGRDDDETIMPRSGRSGLPTVAERKSEYGIEGLIASYEARGDTSSGTSRPDASLLATTAESGTAPASYEGVPAISPATSRLTPRREIAQDKVDQVTRAGELQEIDQTEGVKRDETLRSRHSLDKVGKGPQEDTQLGDLEKVQSGEELRRLSTSPKLPELGRLSVFGLDLFSSSASSDPSNSSSFNLPTSSPPPPVPHIPSSHTIVSPSSPLSTVIESPSSSSTLPQQDARLGQARQGQGQASGDGDRTEVESRSGHASSEDTVPSHNDTGSGSASPVHVSQHASRGEPGSESAEHHISGAAPDSPQSRPSSAGEGPAADSPKGSQSGAATLPVLHAGFDPVTSKSESEQLPGVDKALPALPSEVSVVTPDPQASQLPISAPIPIGPSEQDSSEGDNSNALPTGNTKLAVHPLLREHSEQAKALGSQVSTGSNSRATTAPLHHLHQPRS